MRRIWKPRKKKEKPLPKFPHGEIIEPAMAVLQKHPEITLDHVLTEFGLTLNEWTEMFSEYSEASLKYLEESNDELKLYRQEREREYLEFQKYTQSFKSRDNLQNLPKRNYVQVYRYGKPVNSPQRGTGSSIITQYVENGHCHLHGCWLEVSDECPQCSKKNNKRR